MSRRAVVWVLGSVAVVILLRLWWAWFVPDVSPLREYNPESTAYIRLYVSRMKRLGKRPVVLMRWTPIDQISENLVHAVVISEDDMFYRHHGVDWGSVRNALRYDWSQGKMARGASTITQQLARNLYLSPARSPLRKIREALIAWRLEKTLGKRRILELYLNVVEWGMGIYGAQAASEIYFGKSAAELTPDEAVALASALPSPWKLNPGRAPGPRLEHRRQVILERMRRAGYLPRELQEIQVPEEVGRPVPPQEDEEASDSGPEKSTGTPAPSMAPGAEPSSGDVVGSPTGAYSAPATEPMPGGAEISSGPAKAVKEEEGAKWFSDKISISTATPDSGSKASRPGSASPSAQP